MASCAPQTFANVSAAAWGCLKTKAAARGVTLASDRGTIGEAGVSIDYAYDAATQTLRLTCTSKPLFISCATINGKIHELIDGTGCLGTP
jgi:hypothetical protein